MNDTQTSETVEQRVRATLRSVAATVAEDAFATTVPTPTRKPNRRRRIALGIGAAAAVPLMLAAARFIPEGSEYVKTIPPSRIVMTGSVDGSRYLLIESDRIDECGRPVTGVELVEERENLVGSEWNTSGYEYGEYIDTDCGYVNDATRYLENPALFTDSGSRVGDSFVWVFAVHPSVDTVRITSGGYSKDLPVYEVDGAGYAPFEIPRSMHEYTSELLIDGEVVPGSEQVQEVPRP